jgi:hypothetical protein
VARLLVAVGRPGAGVLLDISAQIRAAIHQPPAPTEKSDLDATRARSGEAGYEPADGSLNLTLSATAVRKRVVVMAREFAERSHSQSERRRAGE